MIELVFVIVVIGIIAKFGVEFLIKAYEGYIFSAVQNRLQTQTEIALEQITNRLQYRIKPSTIVRRSDTGAFTSLSNAADIPQNTILEWVGYDIDGLRGTTTPLWSGFIDLNNASASASQLISLNTDTSAENTMINALSNGNSDFNNSAIFFIGGNTNISGYGWNAVALADQNHTMHPIKSSTSVNILESNFGNPNDFTGQDVYEFYQLAWTAYALVYSGTNASSAIEYINRLDDGTANPAKLFDTNGSVPIMSTAIPNVTGTIKNGDWTKAAANVYTVKVRNVDVNFTYDPAFGSFDCVVNATAAGEICRRLRN